jgi:hypothetical protein
MLKNIQFSDYFVSDIVSSPVTYSKGQEPHLNCLNSALLLGV